MPRLTRRRFMNTKLLLKTILLIAILLLRQTGEQVHYRTVRSLGTQVNLGTINDATMLRGFINDPLDWLDNAKPVCSD